MLSDLDRCCYERTERVPYRHAKWAQQFVDAGDGVENPTEDDDESWRRVDADDVRMDNAMRDIDNSVVDAWRVESG